MQKEGANHRGSIIESKIEKNSSYACHICGLNGHKWQIVQSLLRCRRCFMGNVWQ
jgi:hypothetical protein